MTFTFLRSNSGLIFAMYPSSVVQTGVKSLGCEKSTAHELPIHSWKRIGPSVVCASKSGAVSPMCNAIVMLLSVIPLVSRLLTGVLHCCYSTLGHSTGPRRRTARPSGGFEHGIQIALRRRHGVAGEVTLKPGCHDSGCGVGLFLRAPEDVQVVLAAVGITEAGHCLASRLLADGWNEVPSQVGGDGLLARLESECHESCVHGGHSFRACMCWCHWYGWGACSAPRVRRLVG